MKFKSEILLIDPPFALLEFPSIGLSILKEITLRKNVSCSIIYGNIFLAERIGIEKYDKITKRLSSLYLLFGEKLFSHIAYQDKDIRNKRNDENEFFNVDEYNFLLVEIKKWINFLVESIASSNTKILGITTGHQQTNAAISIINAVKKKNKEITCVIGGSACDGDMSEGILSLSDSVDYVFSGESEISWGNFIDAYLNNNLPKRHTVIKSVFLNDLNKIEISSDFYSDYISQYSKLLNGKKVSVLYETSRGCWWGEKNKCNFCGVNGCNKHYRHKDESIIINDLKKIMSNESKIAHVQMVDTLMPKKYFVTLLDSLHDYFPTQTFFYEQRADLSLNEIVKLKKTGINYTQVGIEGLSSNLLKLLNKGITLEQNIQFLRYCKAVGLLIGWNFLTNIPNDKKEDWDKVLELIPLILHLNPPLQIRDVEIVRFSPYYEKSSEFKIHDIKPNKVYEEVFPKYSKIDKLAWIFDSDFESYSKSSVDFRNKLNSLVSKWIESWSSFDRIPELKVIKEKEQFFLVDSRDVLCKTVSVINYEQACICLFNCSDKTVKKYEKWITEKKVVYYSDNKIIPLATSNPDIISELLLWKKGQKEI